MRKFSEENGVTGPIEPSRRRRRTAESAREEILEAARTRLTDEGPEGIRLKSIAADVGISHSAILHHFGSREGLMKALRDDAFDELARDMKQRLERAPESGDPTLDFFETIAEALGAGGIGKLLAWQIMVGAPPDRASLGRAVFGPEGSGGLVSGLAMTLHRLRTDRALANGDPEPDLYETRSITAMAAFTVLGESIAGDTIMRSADLGREPEDRKNFRNWLAQLLHRVSFEGARGPGDKPRPGAGEDRDPA